MPEPTSSIHLAIEQRAAVEDQDWRERAACRGQDPALFFPRSSTPTRDELAPALVVCARCPVARPCLEHALEHDEPGVWGGTTTRERSVIRRRRLIDGRR